MQLEQLLADFEQLSYSQRTKRMVVLGQQVQHNPKIGQLIEQLAQSTSIYQRRLALLSCYGSHNSSLIRQFIADPAQSLRQLTINLMVRYCSDADVQACLPQLAATSARKALTLLAKHNRFGLIDGFLANLAPQQRPRYQTLGSEYYLSQDHALIDSLTIKGWQQLARFKPQLCSSLLQTMLGQQHYRLEYLQPIVTAALPKLAITQPDLALGLAQQALNRGLQLTSSALEDLAYKRPQAVVDLIIQQKQFLYLNWGALVRTLSLAQLEQLADLQLLPQPHEWLKQIPIAYRKTLYAAYHRQWYDQKLKLREQVLQALPSAERHIEARRIQRLPEMATQIQQRIRYAAFLPWDEAHTTLQAMLNHSEASFRGEALAALIQVVRYQPEYAQTVLDLAHSRRNEQDPVRVQMLTALSELPARRWKTEHLSSIEQVIRDSLDARDCSDSSISLLQRWLSKLFEVHPAASMALIGQISRERGKIFVQSHGRELSASEAQALCSVLLPIMQPWHRRQQAHDILSIVNFIGKAIKAVPELVQMLEQIANEQQDWAATSALQALHRYARENFNAAVPRLLANDPSWITQPLVVEFLHNKRQELLTPFLPTQRYKGKFSTGKAAYILPIRQHFERWTPKQQQIFAQALIEQTHQKDHQHPSLVDYAERLAYLSEVAPTRLIELAALDAPIVVLRDKALAALSRRETYDGLATLIAALDDERARIAIYALRRILLRMPINQALDILRNVPRAKVTVAKEIVRLIGDLNDHHAYQELLTWYRPELHRDVQIAVVHALNNYLDRAETWAIFESIRQYGQPTVVASLATIRLEHQTPEIQHQFLALLANLLEHPELEVRQHVVDKCRQITIADPGRILVKPLLKVLQTDPTELKTLAVNTIVNLYGTHDRMAVAEIIQASLSNRLVLALFATQLETRVWQWKVYRPLVKVIVDELAHDPLTIQIQIKLINRYYDEQAWFNFIQTIQQRGLLNPDGFRSLIEAIEFEHNVTWIYQRHVLESYFYQASDPYLRRIGLAAFCFKTKRLGWHAADYQRLAEYQADPDPLVAGAAQFIFAPQPEQA